MALTPDEELISFLQDSSVNPLIRSSALNYILGLTGEKKGVDHLLKHSKYLPTLCSVAEESDFGRNASKCLINISSYESGASALCNMSEISFIEWLVEGLHHNASFIELKCHIISNISRQAALSENLSEWFHSNPASFKKLVDLFCSQDSSIVEKFSSLATLFGNLTQIPTGQRLFLSKETSLIKNLLPYTTYMDSATRRIGVVRALRNCCFSTDHHMWLLEEADILPALLLPLAGPEEFDDEENDKLPLDLQYLGEDKQREPNPTIRKLLIESITKLCATKQGRMFIKDAGVYYILRELHKWESDTSIIEACVNLVAILIGDEPEPGMENLMTVQIPEEIEQMFEEEEKEKQYYPQESGSETIVIS